MNSDSPHDDPPTGLTFGGTIFLEQSAHVAVLDGGGRIITVNAAWERFGHDNGLDPNYAFPGADYLAVCRRAAGSGASNEGAAEAMVGLRGVLSSSHSRFSLTYPCHAPHAQRWFLMYAQPLSRGFGGAVVSHIDVTSLKLAGLISDETAESLKPGVPATGGGSNLAASIAMQLATLESLSALLPLL